jgi:hypothetical protein
MVPQSLLPPRALDPRPLPRVFLAIPRSESYSASLANHISLEHVSQLVGTPVMGSAGRNIPKIPQSGSRVRVRLGLIVGAAAE